MTAAAVLEYCEGEETRMPGRLHAALLSRKFGTAAVYGNEVMPVPEMQAANLALAVFDAYNGRKGSDNWAKWGQDNPAANKLLDWARGL